MGLLSEDEIASRTRMIGPWDYDPEDKMLVRETTFKAVSYTHLTLPTMS